MADGDVKQWLSFAKTDLGVAKHLMKHYYPKPLEIIGYHCQQSAEKAVKAVIMNLDRHMGIPQTHDISFLLNQVKYDIAVSENLFDCADELTKYGISARYPSCMLISDMQIEKAVQCAETILAWAESLLNLTTDSNA